MSYVGIENEWFLALLITVPRVLGVFVVLPFFGTQTVPGLVRNSVVIIIAAFITPITVGAVSVLPLDLLSMLIIIIKEFFLGFIMGYLFSIPFWVVGSAGFYLDLQRGSMSAQLFSNMLSDQTSPLGDFLAKLAAVTLFASGGFLLLIEVVIKSYLSWPVDTFFPHFGIKMAGAMADQFGLIFLTGMLVAGPIGAVLFIVQFGVSLLARYIPQLNVFMLLMPIKAGVAILLMIFYVYYVARYLRDVFLHPDKILTLLEGIL